MLKIRAQKDFYAGLLYALLAAAFLWFGRDYKMGIASRMGAGYFPIVLGWILFAFGAASIFRSFLVDGTPVSSIAWKKVSIVTFSIVIFGFLIGKAGLIFALPALVTISAAASTQSKFDRNSLLFLISLTAFCILVFVKGLGVPMPIFGEWFDGLIPASWQR